MVGVPFWAEVTLRSLLTFAVMLMFTRLLGKRQITQLTYFEYITGITLGSLAAYAALEESIHWLYPLLAIAVWTLASLGAELLTLKSKTARNLIEGKGTVIIKDGKILEDNLHKERYTTDELLSQLRQKNVFRAADVEFAVLETTGNLSVLLKREHQPITPTRLGVEVPNVQEPQTVIMDGKLLDEPLATIGLNREWLHTELEKIGVTLDNVYLAQVDGYGQLYVDLYDDELQVPAPSSLALLWTNLKKIQADLELFALSTSNASAKGMYQNAAKSLQVQLAKLEPYLTR